MQCALQCWAFADLSFTESSPLLPRDTKSDADQNNDAAGGDASDGDVGLGDAGDGDTSDGDVDGDAGPGDADGDKADGRCNEKYYILPPHHDNIVCDDLQGGTFGPPEYDEGAIQKM